MKKTALRIGQIGAGGRGELLGQLSHQPTKGSRIVACCDRSDQTIARCQRDFGRDIFITGDYQELLAQDIDAVIIATPDYLHEEHVLAALQRGLTVYLEKPMALTVDGCDRILAAAKKHRARLFVGHNMRHMAFVRKMKALIDAGTIGEVKACWCRHFVGHGGDFYFRDWHAERRYTTGLLLQKAAHDIDVIHWLCGGYSRLVSAMGALTLYDQLPGRQPASDRPRKITVKDMKLDLFPPTKHRGLNHRIDVEDLSTMQMKLSNGVFATYAQCHYTPDYWRNYTVIGTEGRMENFGNGEPGTLIRVWNRRSNYNATGDATYKIPPAGDMHGGADPLIIREFLRYARTGGHINTSPIAARESVAAGCVATDSLRNGGVVLKVPAPKPALVRWFDAGGA